MSATIEQLNEFQNSHHVNCFVCGKAGMGLVFEICEDGELKAKVNCRDIHQGYNNILHGGIISSLLDCAMVNCLFAHGLVTLTAEMKVRFRHPVAVNKSLTVSAKILRRTKKMHSATAQLIQDGEVMADAVGKFMKKPAD